MLIQFGEQHIDKVKLIIQTHTYGGPFPTISLILSGENWVELEALRKYICQFLKSLITDAQVELVSDVLRRIGREPQEGWLQFVARCHMSFRSKSLDDPTIEK